MFDKAGRLVRYMGSMRIKSGAGQCLIVNSFIDKNGFLKGPLRWTGSQLGDSRVSCLAQSIGNYCQAEQMKEIGGR